MSTKTSETQPAQQGRDGTKQINCRLSLSLLTRFKSCCEQHGRQQTEVIEQLLVTWCDHASETGIRHLNGEVCPITSLITGLAASVRLEVEAKHRKP